jgi:hypothetical protein
MELIADFILFPHDCGDDCLCWRLRDEVPGIRNILARAVQRLGVEEKAKWSLRRDARLHRAAREKNPERIRARDRERYKKNQQRILGQFRARYQKNPKKFIKQQKDRNDPPRVSEAELQLQRANPDRSDFFAVTASEGRPGYGKKFHDSVYKAGECVVCLECGVILQALVQGRHPHLGLHGMTRQTYRQKWGRNAPVVNARTREKMSRLATFRRDKSLTA